MPEVDVVEIELEEIVFREACVEGDGQHAFDDLAAPGALVGEEALLDDLLRDGAAALRDAAGADVREQRAGDADRIDAEVAAEADVFRGEKRVGDMRRKLLEEHRRREAPVRSVDAHDFARAAACRRWTAITVGSRQLCGASSRAMRRSSTKT